MAATWPTAGPTSSSSALAAAADGFLTAYERLTGVAHHSFREMASIFEHGPSHWTPVVLAACEPDLARAVRALTGDTPPRGNDARQRRAHTSAPTLVIVIGVAMGAARSSQSGTLKAWK